MPRNYVPTSGPRRRSSQRRATQQPAVVPQRRGIDPRQRVMPQPSQASLAQSAGYTGNENVPSLQNPSQNTGILNLLRQQQPNVPTNPNPQQEQMMQLRNQLAVMPEKTAPTQQQTFDTQEKNNVSYHGLDVVNGGTGQIWGSANDPRLQQGNTVWAGGSPTYDESANYQAIDQSMPTTPAPETPMAGGYHQFMQARQPIQQPMQQQFQNPGMTNNQQQFPPYPSFSSPYPGHQAQRQQEWNPQIAQHQYGHPASGKGGGQQEGNGGTGQIWGSANDPRQQPSSGKGGSTGYPQRRSGKGG